MPIISNQHSSISNNPSLIIGYGNLDRQDDGVAWHVLNRLAQRLGRPALSEIGEGFEQTGAQPELLFQLQLTPELAEIIAAQDRVAFVDAHTGAVEGDLHIEVITPTYQASAFTHHMTPQTCLSLSQSLYHHAPEALLISVRGFQFEFGTDLSEKTSQLADQAVEHLWEWIFREDR
jgi:hydrogenase maturation protease